MEAILVLPNYSAADWQHLYVEVTGSQWFWRQRFGDLN